MKRQKQSDFVYRERFENCDPTDLRCRAQIDLNWRFIRGDAPGAEDPAYDDSAWRLLNLPHDWSIEGEYDQGNPSGGSCAFLPTGVGWYRKTLSIPRQWREGRRVRLVFDGVFMNSTVYADGVKVGGREYGWLSFSCDVTEQVQGKESVVIAVKADNSVQPSARWYTGSGIYSHVWVVSSQAVHAAENGVYVTTPAEFGQAPTGEADLQTVVENAGAAAAAVSVRSAVCRKDDGAQVAQVTSAPVTVPAGQTVTVSQTANVAAPLLWSVEDPNLYLVKTEVLVNGTAVDDCITEFGFRSLSYDVNGLYLNGVNTKLKGVSTHWALGAVGAAQPDNIIRYKILMLKRMGCNCIRTSHNACPPVFYQLCDELGMMVMDELFEGERGKTVGDYGTRFFADHWREDVEYWVKRDRNHPSVVVWSIGNETGSNNDNTGISAYIKNFDATRPTTGSAIHYGVDIPGANGQSEPGSFTQPIADLPLIATEAPHTHAVRGVYRTRTWRRGTWSAIGAGNTIPDLTGSEVFKYDWSSSAVGSRTLPSDYDNAVSQTSVRRHWTLTRDNAWRLGEFRWTGFDYLGEANYVLGGWPYRMFHSGAVDTALFEKDMYYLYQSMWTDTPMLHILPSWTHPTMEEGTEIPVWVYSNCEKVELFLNGVSQGVVDRGPVDVRDQYGIQFDWLVPYAPGTITAVGYDADGSEVLRDSYVTASAPAGITLENTAGETVPADASYLGQVTVTTVDRDGNFYPYGENRAYYHVSGPAYIKAADNGSPVDTESHVNFNRNAFMGLNKVFVAPTQDDGDILFTAASVLGEKRQLTSDLVSIDVQQLALRGNPAMQTFEIYYTTDGSAPDKASQRYTGAFSVPLETTVKAAVYPAGSEDPMFVMEETFGADEGLFWVGTGSDVTAQNVYPAADAVISGEAIQKEDYGYTEQYINFNGRPGSAEYTVHAQTAGDYYVAVCYNNGSGAAGDYKTVNVAVNGVSTGDPEFFYNGAPLTFWSYRFLRVSLNEGENKVRFRVPPDGPNLKELILWRGEDAYTAGKVTALDADGEIVEKDSCFDGQAIDVHSGGAVVWTVSGKPAGTYRLRFAYSTPRGSLKETVLKINGAVVAYLSGVRCSPDYGSSWGLCEKEVYLAPGVNTVSIVPAAGGTLVGGVIPEELALSSREAVRIDASCVENTRLAAGAVPFLTGTDTTSESAAWDAVTDPKGTFYLVNRESGKLLASDGTALFFADGDADGNARWMRAGEAEHYDYLVHVLSGKVLAVGSDGSVFLDDPENYEDSDMRTNRAYWRLHP